MEEAKVALSNAEWRLMNYLWDESPKSIKEMVSYFEGITDWDRHVIHMMLKRLVNKGAVSFQEKGRSKLYYPIIERETTCTTETEEFLDRVYQGDLGLMLTTMVKNEKLSAEDIKELRAILRKEG